LKIKRYIAGIVSFKCNTDYVWVHQQEDFAIINQIINRACPSPGPKCWKKSLQSVPRTN